MSDVDRDRALDAKAREVQHAAAWSTSTKDRKSARQWLRRHGYQVPPGPPPGRSR